MAGCFITLEGTEGVGKSTQIEHVAERLRGAGHSVVVTREPGGTPLGERVREWVLDTQQQTLAPIVETLLMFAARAEHLERIIRPALAEGRWVVCDRFTDATFAYQGAGRGVAEAFLQQLAAAVQRGLEPDLTLLLDAPVAVGMARIRARPADRFEREDEAFFERVRQGYLARAERHPQRIKLVDATLDAVAVRARIDDHLAQLLAEASRDG